MSLFRVYVNDLSLEGFPDNDAVRASLNALLAARRNAPNLGRALFCSRSLTGIRGASGTPLITAIQTFPRDEKLAILQWLAARGPFLEDEREATEEDLYYHSDIDVTDQGLGEGARQRQGGHDASVFSLVYEGRAAFRDPKLTVVQGLLEEPIDTIEVQNHSSLDSVTQSANAALPEPTTWEELLGYCRDRYPNLLIGTHCEDVLKPLPFYPNVSRRTVELLRVLDEMQASVDAETGALTEAGEALKQTHFVGKKACFTGESDGNERDFGKEMTFPDPADPTLSIQCFWHGKIKTPQFRIHFEWPPKPAGPLKVTYIGPKISKR